MVRVEVVEAHPGESVVHAPELRETGCRDEVEAIGLGRGRRLDRGADPAAPHVEARAGSERLRRMDDALLVLDFVATALASPDAERVVAGRARAQLELESDAEVPGVAGRATAHLLDATPLAHRVVE